MATIDALLDKLCRKPTPADFKFSDVRRIMSHFGYSMSNKGATSGSRVRFYSQETEGSLMLHKPHPGDQMPRAAVDAVVDFLKEYGHI